MPIKRSHVHTILHYTLIQVCMLTNKQWIQTEIAPIVGSEDQANDLIRYIREGQQSEEGVWETNIFGKSIGELMEDGIRNKIAMMDDECQLKLQDTMQKIVNDNNGGMVCIIL